MTRLSLSLLSPSVVRAHLLTSDNLSTRRNRREGGRERERERKRERERWAGDGRDATRLDAIPRSSHSPRHGLISLCHCADRASREPFDSTWERVDSPSRRLDKFIENCETTLAIEKIYTYIYIYIVYIYIFMTDDMVLVEDMSPLAYISVNAFDLNF